MNHKHFGILGVGLRALGPKTMYKIFIYIFPFVSGVKETRIEIDVIG